MTRRKKIDGEGESATARERDTVIARETKRKRM